jgi:hypothetical protein
LFVVCLQSSVSVADSLSRTNDSPEAEGVTTPKIPECSICGCMVHKKTTCTQQSPAQEASAVLDLKEHQFLIQHLQWYRNTSCRQESAASFDDNDSHDLQKPPFGQRVFVWVPREKKWAPGVLSVFLFVTGCVYRFLYILYCTSVFGTY